jgi:hypothetical protein
MGKTGAAFRGAWPAYRQHFRELWIASALLSLPLGLVGLLRGLLAARADLPLSGPSVAALGFVDSGLRAITPAAVALLAADLRAGGIGGWRQAWARALARIEPIVSGHVAVSFTIFVSMLGVLWLLVYLLRGHEGPLSTLISLGVAGPVTLVALAFSALAPVVTSVGATGGVEAVRRTWRLLTSDFRRNVATLVLAQLLALLPTLILILIVLPRSGLTLLALFLLLYEISARPVVMLVALSVYCDATGADAARLRAELDAR